MDMYDMTDTLFKIGLGVLIGWILSSLVSKLKDKKEVKR